MIKKFFGRTGHKSTRIIFGGYALSKATRDEAASILKLLLEYGVNHIDTAAMYGNAEKCIGQWMEHHRDEFFLATKSRRRTYEGAREDLQRSLQDLKVDSIDLWELHSLTNEAGWEKVMGSGGALKAFTQAREEGLVRFLGVTGHGKKAPLMLKRSVEYFDFDSVLLPYNFALMQNPRYASEFNELVDLCRRRKVAIQTIKSIARRPWGRNPRTFNTYFYEPLVDQAAIDKAIHWAMGLEDSFVVTAGDMRLLPQILDAATRYEKRPSDSVMQALVDEFEIREIAASMSDLK